MITNSFPHYPDMAAETNNPLVGAFAGVLEPISTSEILLLQLNKVPMHSLIAHVVYENTYLRTFMDIDYLRPELIQITLRLPANQGTKSFSIKMARGQNLAKDILDQEGIYIALDSRYLRTFSQEC